MTTLRICREHDLDEDECRAVAKDVLGQLVSKFGGRVTESRGDFNYKHPSGITASLQNQQEQLIVEVKLGMMTRSFAPKLEQEINLAFDEHIG